MTRISVIVAMYETQDYVGDCIRSLKAQTFDDFQVIAVDDGSPDNVYEYAVEAAEGDARFVFLKQENKGLSAARNAGLAKAEGEFVLFLDSDDLYTPEALELLDYAQRQANADVVDFSAQSFYEDEGARKLHREDYDSCRAVSGVHTGPQIFTRYVDDGRYVASACLHMMKRSLFDHPELAFAEGLLHEDELFTPLLYAYTQRVVCIDEPLYMRRIHRDSIMTRPKTVKSVSSLFQISQRLQTWVLKNAEAYPISYIDAFVKNIAILNDAAFRYGQDVCPEDMEGFLDSLPNSDRILFDRDCRYGPAIPEKRHQEALGSFSYKLGCALTAPVRMLRRSK